MIICEVSGHQLHCNKQVRSGMLWCIISDVETKGSSTSKLSLFFTH